MRYREWREQDWVLARGPVEGAVRHFVGERFDGSGMRWIPKRAEGLRHLRWIEWNGDGSKFVAWLEERTRERLTAGVRARILTDQPLGFEQAA